METLCQQGGCRRLIRYQERLPITYLDPECVKSIRAVDNRISVTNHGKKALDANMGRFRLNFIYITVMAFTNHMSYRKAVASFSPSSSPSMRCLSESAFGCRFQKACQFPQKTVVTRNRVGNFSRLVSR